MSGKQMECFRESACESLMQRIRRKRHRSIQKHVLDGFRSDSTLLPIEEESFIERILMIRTR